MSQEELVVYLERMNKLPREPFKPCVYYCKITDSLQVYATDDNCYAESTDSPIDIFRNSDTREIIGFHVYGLRGIVRRTSMLQRDWDHTVIELQLAEIEAKEK